MPLFWVCLVARALRLTPFCPPLHTVAFHYFSLSVSFRVDAFNPPHNLPLFTHQPCHLLLSVYLVVGLNSLFSSILSSLLVSLRLSVCCLVPLHTFRLPFYTLTHHSPLSVVSGMPLSPSLIETAELCVFTSYLHSTHLV